MELDQTEVAKLETIGRHLTAELLSRKPAWVQGAVSQWDSDFLAGLVSKLEPLRIVEIGVASGWSSSVLLATQRQILKPESSFSVSGIDLSADLYTDRSRKTGSAVAEVVPDALPHYTLLTGEFSFDAMPKVGQVDFAFIDAHHMHPWPVLDLIAVLPFLSAGSWVALHDLNLCRIPRHEHRNRGPFYLYYLWQGAKLHSTAEPTMIGAIRLDRDPALLMKDVFQILATPWELALPEADISRMSGFVTQHFGTAAAAEFDAAALSGRQAKSG